MSLNLTFRSFTSHTVTEAHRLTNFLLGPVNPRVSPENMLTGYTLLLVIASLAPPKDQQPVTAFRFVQYTKAFQNKSIEVLSPVSCLAH